MIRWQLILYVKWMLMKKKPNGRQNTKAKPIISVHPVARLLLKKIQKNTCKCCSQHIQHLSACPLKRVAESRARTIKENKQILGGQENLVHFCIADNQLTFYQIFNITIYQSTSAMKLQMYSSNSADNSGPTFIVFEKITGGKITFTFIYEPSITSLCQKHQNL